MMPERIPYLTPVTFYNASETGVESRPQDIIHAGCSRSCVSAIASLGLPVMTEPDHQVAPGETVLLGCSDGTIYVFGQATIRMTPKSPRPSSLVASSPPSPFHLSRGSHPASRSTSPSSSSTFAQAPFNVSSRSRVVSGISTEPVEAPKNYVDFDEEPAKLKEMLQGRAPKDKIHVTDVPVPGTIASPTIASPMVLSQPPGKRRREEKRSSSTRGVDYSTSAGPRSPPKAGQRQLALRYHIVPAHSTANRVNDLHFLHNSAIFASLQRNGDLHVYQTQDGSCIASMQLEDKTERPPANMMEVESVFEAWHWKSMHVLEASESTWLLLLGHRETDYVHPAIDSERDDAGVKCRAALVELRLNEDMGLLEVALEKVSDWIMMTSPHTVGLSASLDGAITLHHINQQQQLELQSLRCMPPMHIDSPAEMSTEDHSMSVVPALQLPNPFKIHKSRSAEHLQLPSKEAHGRVAVLDEYIVGTLLPEESTVVGCTLRKFDPSTRGLVWNAKELLGFDIRDRELQVLFDVPMPDIRQLHWLSDDAFMVKFEDRYELHHLEMIDGNGDVLPATSVNDPEARVRPRLQYVTQLGHHEASAIASEMSTISTSLDSDGRRSINIWPPPSKTPQETAPEPRTLWKATHSTANLDTVYLSATLPLDVDLIILGYSDGYIRRSSLARISGELSLEQSFSAVSNAPLNGYIASLHVVFNGRTKERFVVGGADDGSIAFWSLDTLALCARWTIFIAPLASVIMPPDDKGPLRGCALCISKNGTIAVIAIDGFQLLYVIPAAPWPLQRMSLGGNDLLLIYANKMARLWDLKTKEFWRSMNIDKAEELLGQRHWAELPFTSKHSTPETVVSGLGSDSQGLDGVATLLVDLERFVAESNAVTRAVSTSRDQTRIIFSTLDNLRSVLSTLLTWGLSGDIDGICRDKLGIPTSATSVGTPNESSIIVYQVDHPQDAWCISEEVSAARCLALTLVLKALALFEEYSEAANTVILFYATSLSSVVGPDYQPPSLSFLAQRWFDGSNETRHAVRMLFDAAVAALTDEETMSFAEKWQPQLPCLQPPAEHESPSSALALFLCGYLAGEKYSLLSPSLLTDISKSVALYLHDEHSIHRILAIDLCSRGFHIWQHYIDAMEILRAMFTLATRVRKDSITTQNVGAQARAAVLAVAASNTPLFMTTLGLDILTPASVEYRKSVLQIVAFLIRKRPLVLYPNLPRLMEAVVKSLDPNSTTSRDAVLDTATEILGHVVKTFPTVDFHMGTQRLAVGTSEGAIVMYDLKTAIRLYVLEGHKKRIAACSFSPDGRRLVTLSLEESVVLVWKVGTSFSSFFNPGAPPRQGHGGSQPFKTLSFNVGDEADMTIAATLEWVRFEWTADRSVKLKIRQSTLTFST
ncbi:hypothetical protein HGRIS_005631 [Hohenbuehelia grisea]|uniref:WD40 repeat-like protein n=1 Tax=Hohenbuehelia grisea TaxID=104357 RepID=A0ABR3JYG7_9AGAR